VKSWLPFEWKGQYFRNRLGTAGGLDKNAKMVVPLFKLGFGFVEVGTVTPLPQGPNSGKILDRDWEHRVLWNRMGFPNAGMSVVKQRLSQVRNAGGPVWLNVGKNRHTDLSQAAQDYSLVTRELEPFSDTIVINISSPNTAHLRELQSPRYLGPLIKSVRRETQKPILLKLSPDQTALDIRQAMGVALNEGVDGFVLTNTTLSREGDLRHWPQEGGISGAPLQALSLQALKVAVDFRSQISSHFLIVSVGGILTPKDVKLRLDMGADLVQVYSALIFEGFSFAQNVSDYFHVQKNSASQI
jgi:dihydroorotate dehydrogenase